MLPEIKLRDELCNFAEHFSVNSNILPSSLFIRAPFVVFTYNKKRREGSIFNMSILCVYVPKIPVLHILISPNKRVIVKSVRKSVTSIPHIVNLNFICSKTHSYIN